MRIGSTSAQFLVLYEAGVLLASKLFGAKCLYDVELGR
jgi:hypothetical protein